jgi:hypothetical protein
VIELWLNCDCYLKNIVLQKHLPEIKIPAHAKFSFCDICFKTNVRKRRCRSDKMRSTISVLFGGNDCD